MPFPSDVDTGSSATAETEPPTSGDIPATDGDASTTAVSTTDGDVSAEAVHDALRALADRTTVGSERSQVVREGSEAVEDLRTAAAFVDDGGLSRLRRARDDAADVGDDTLAARADRVLDAFESYREVAAATASERGTETPDDARPAVERSGVSSDDGASPDHFHRGRGTFLRAGGQRRDR